MAEPDTDRPVCGEPADRRGFFRCQKDAGHNGDRHHTAIPGGDYTWGYVPTAAEAEPQETDVAEQTEAQRLGEANDILTGPGGS